MLLNSNHIKSHFKTSSLRDIPILIYDQIDSTNAELKRQILKAASKLNLPHICLAETQTAGKGQGNKHWHSPFGENIYLSMGFSFAKPLQGLEGLSLAMAIAICQSLFPYIPSSLKSDGYVSPVATPPPTLQIKWPNDIFHNGRKLAGILIETASSPNQPTSVIIGIGLNVNMERTDERIDKPWTSLALLSGQPHDRNVLVATLIEKLFEDFNLFQLAGFVPFFEQWEPYDFLRNKEITLHDAKGVHTGIAAGINLRGQLLLRNANGTLNAYSSGQLAYTLLQNAD